MPRYAADTTPEERMQKKFLLLDEEWRDKVAALEVNEIKAVITEVVNNENENQKAKDDDQDLSEKKESYQSAAESYKEATKFNRLKVKYCLRVLNDKGGI